jgi:heme/copper-type cytochrome/quinol oxidase subunit 3
MTAATAPAVRIRPGKLRSYSTAWWGMVMLITTEAMIFGLLLSSYFFLRASSKQWPLGGIEVPKLQLAGIFSLVLWGSSVPIFWAEAAIKRGDVRRLRIGLLISFVMGAAFLGFTFHDFDELTFGWRTNAYGSIFYVIVGLHAFHVFVGLLMSVVVQIKAAQGKITAARHTTAEVFSLYWHFVDVVWLFVFPALFLSPHIR